MSELHLTRNLAPHFYRGAQGSIVTPNCLLCGLPEEATIPDPSDPSAERRIPLHTEAPTPQEMTISELVGTMTPLLIQFTQVVAAGMVQLHRDVAQLKGLVQETGDGGDG